MQLVELGNTRKCRHPLDLITGFSQLIGLAFEFNQRIRFGLIKIGAFGGTKNR